MKVIAFYPTKGAISSVIVENIQKRYQQIFRNQNWYMSDIWASIVIKDQALVSGFSELSKGLDFDFFIKNIDQFEE